MGTSGIEQRNGTCYTEKECKQRNGFGVGEFLLFLLKEKGSLSQVHGKWQKSFFLKHDQTSSISWGDTGDTGDTGGTVQTGLTGRRGHRGNRNDRGERGDKGQRGDRGQRGHKGHRRHRGHRGHRGDMSDRANDFKT